MAALSPTPPLAPLDSPGAACGQRAENLDADVVRAQLARILASELFARSERLSRFLGFVVEHALSGQRDPLKEYVIAVEVFDKDASFDSRLDPIVRVEAGRLRAKLREYYDGSGAADCIRVELAKRGYAPSFRYAEAALVDEATDTLVATPQPTARPGASEPSESTRRPMRAVALARRPLLAVALAVPLLLAALVAWIPLAPGDLSKRSNAGLSLVVLPLRDLSRSGQEDFFADAMTDALITHLAKDRHLRVISTRSAMRYRNASRTVAEIARELDVTHVLEGSVAREARQARISVQLVDARTRANVWAESYERDVADVFALQQDVAARVARELVGTIAPATPHAATAPLEPALLEAYAKGRYFGGQLSREGFRKGIRYFREAIERRPSYAPAHAGLASCYCLLAGHGLELVAPREAMADARAAAQRALELDDSLAEPHAILGIIRTKFDWDWEGAERSLRRALEIAPGYAQGHVWYSVFLEAMGRHKEAIARARKARELDPLSREANVNLAWQLHQAGRDDEELAQLGRTLELAPDFWGVHWGFGQYHLLKGNHAEALAALRRAVDSGGGHTLALSTLGFAYGRAGRREEAQQVARRLLAMARESYVSPAHIAAVFAGLGDKDAAFAQLEKAYVMRARSLAWLDVAHEWDGLRSDARFAALRRRVGLAR